LSDYFIIANLPEYPQGAANFTLCLL